MDTGIKLTHLGQCHKPPFNYTAGPEYVEEMIESQIKVANYIKNHPDALVFLEGLTESFSGIPEGVFTLSAKMIFPTGLPDDAAKLNSLQKDYLYNAEAAVRTMNRLGELKSMYRTISPEQSEVVDSLISDGDWSHMFGTREVAAMECIKEVLEKNPDKKEVILVYGDEHDFSKHCLDYGFKHEKISCSSFNRMNRMQFQRQTNEVVRSEIKTKISKDDSDKIIDAQMNPVESKETISSNIGDKRIFKITETVTLDVEYDTKIFNTPCLSLLLKDNNIPVPGARLLIEDSSSINEVIGNLENPKGLVKCLNEWGCTAKIIADYIRSKID